MSYLITPATAAALWFLTGQLQAVDDQRLAGVHRVVFLGDSITYSGQYIELIESYLRINQSKHRYEFLDLGLPSETVSGLSEPGHAGGAFPRPDLHERLERVLEQTKPDLIVACYGMNDGIYYPFAESRFEKYQDGMRRLRERATAVKAKVLHVTPPVFDPMPIRSRTLPAGLTEYRQPYEGYDAVLERYSEWLLAQKAFGWDVVDVHGPMKQHLSEARQRDPRLPARRRWGSHQRDRTLAHGTRDPPPLGRPRSCSRRSSQWRTVIFGQTKRTGRSETCPAKAAATQGRLADDDWAQASGDESGSTVDGGATAGSGSRRRNRRLA